MIDPTFSSNRYFPQVFVAKALIIRQSPQTGHSEYLFLQEPPTASWKPGKWGLPGGKLDPGEDVMTALRRELREELGAAWEVTPTGIASIEEIIYFHPVLQRPQLTHHVIISCAAPNPEPPTEVTTQWLTIAQLKQKRLSDLTEFYFPKFFDKISAPDFAPAPLSLISILNVPENDEYKKWYAK